MGDRLQTGKPPRYVTSHPGQLSLAIPPWVGAVSTSESWGVNRHTAWYTSPVSMVSQCKLVSGWGLRKLRSAPPNGPCGSGRTLLYFTCFYFYLLDVFLDLLHKLVSFFVCFHRSFSVYATYFLLMWLGLGLLAHVTHYCIADILNIHCMFNVVVFADVWSKWEHVYCSHCSTASVRRMSYYTVSSSYSFVQEIFEGRMKGKPTRGRKRIQLLDNLADGKDYASLKREAEDRSMGRVRK